MANHSGPAFIQKYQKHNTQFKNKIFLLNKCMSQHSQVNLPAIFLVDSIVAQLRAIPAYWPKTEDLEQSSQREVDSPLHLGSHTCFKSRDSCSSEWMCHTVCPKNRIRSPAFSWGRSELTDRNVELYPQFFLELITTQLRFYMVSPQFSLLIILTM